MRHTRKPQPIGYSTINTEDGEVCTEILSNFNPGEVMDQIDLHSKEFPEWVFAVLWSDNALAEGWMPETIWGADHED